jgi:hypothetical protein
VRLVFYRSQSAGELLDVSFNVVKGQFGLLLRLSFWPIVGVAAIDLISRALPVDSSLVLVTLPLSFAVYSLGEAAVSFAAWQILHGQAVSPAEVWRRVRECLGSVIVGYSLKWLGILVGLVLLIVPGILLLLRWFAVPTANIVEGRGVRESFRRSRDLARGNRRQILVTVGLLDVGMTLGSLALTMSVMDPATGTTPLWLSPITWSLAFLYLAYHAVVSSALYANARVRNEGYDVESLEPIAAGAT